MGVYLPNVDMPKDDKCVTIQICPDGSIWQQYRGTVPNAKAVPVPTPHGRCIDADALKTEVFAHDKLMKDGWNNMDMGMFTGNLMEVVDDAPTILEAEEG